MKIPANNQYILFGGNFVVANKMQWVADRRVKRLSSKQWFLLRTLSDMPKEPLPTISSLAKETDTSRQNVTKILEVLVRQNCVLLGDNPSDHRSHTVQISEHGLYILKCAAQEAGAFLQELFSGISEEECATAARVVVKMIENLNKMQEELR